MPQMRHEPRSYSELILTHPNFGVLVSENHARFLGFIRSKVESDEAAEDILQSAYQRGFEKVHGLRESERLVAWFYRLLRNAIIDHYRRRAVEKKTFAGDLPEAELIPAAPDKQMEKAICECMADLVKTLKPEYADAIRTIELGGKDIETYSKAHRLTKNTTTVRLHRARQSLKKRLVQTCGSCAAQGCLDCHCKKRV